jgi:predicted amidophosphoribosyltransferase
MEQKFCQSCGMTLTNNDLLGTNADGTSNDEYCCYCFKDGKFTQDISMNESIDHCVQYLDEFNKDCEVKYTKEEAIKEMRKFFPQLKRWKNKD